ncbi:MAG: hypothetical protein V3V60_15815 [Sphingomonas aquatilis]|uniref:hypothetical protein n=1 Tax=Sphingomonas aquatilis TaxID=93063 RepID=UPI002F2E9359
MLLIECVPQHGAFSLCITYEPPRRVPRMNVRAAPLTDDQTYAMAELFGFLPPRKPR